MPSRPTLLLASAAVLGVASPTFAQEAPYDDRYDEAHTEHHAGHHVDHHSDEATSIDGSYQGNWEGSWEDESTWHGEWQGTYTDAYGQVVDAAYRGVWVGETRFISEDGPILAHDGNSWRADRDAGRDRRHYTNAHAPGLGYTTAQRNQWLAECRYVMADGGGYSDARYDREPDGALIGGLLGAVAGGIAGNRIADDNRLLGTVVGAGVGGLAGAAIGDAIDGDGVDDYEDMEREELWAARYCEAYLARHEMGAGYHYGYAQPMMMVPVRMGGHHGRRCRRCGEEVVIEEEIIEVDRPAPRPARRVIPAPRSEPGKRTPIN